MRFFQLYQYLAPAILVPLSYWLWFLRTGSDHATTLLIWSPPILFAYVIPGIGTNVLGVWEFTIRLRLGRFRPHHGFVFGSATSMLTWLCLPAPTDPLGWSEVLRAGLVLGSVLGFWNWLYDLAAVECGFIIVYNHPYAAGQGAAAIATDYAPAIFGGFGLCYGASLRIAEWLLLQLGQRQYYWPLLIIVNLVVLTVPVGLFMAVSMLRHGDPGLRPIKRGVS